MQVQLCRQIMRDFWALQVHLRWMNLSRAAESRDSPGDPCKMVEGGYWSHEMISIHNPTKFFRSSHWCRCQKLTKEPGPRPGMTHACASMLFLARGGGIAWGRVQFSDYSWAKCFLKAFKYLGLNCKWICEPGPGPGTIFRLQLGKVFFEGIWIFGAQL